MFEMIGLLIATTVATVVSIVLGMVLGLVAWLLMWGRKRSWRLIVMMAAVPPFSLAYVIGMAILLTIFVPNQPDEFFGDFNEPLPHGYMLKGLGKMPDWAYFDTTGAGRQQPQMPGTVGRLEEDGEMVYGAYAHLHDAVESKDPQKGEPSYFAFDTRSGIVTNFQTLEQLNACAGHKVQLEQSQFFRSQLPGRRLLRRVENAIYLGPPIVATIVCFFLVLRLRFRREIANTSPQPCL
jgi:hypothetical protein